MESKAALWASWHRVSVWIGMPLMLNLARLLMLGFAGLAAVAGFTLVSTVLAFLPFVLLGGLAILVTVVLTVSMAGFLSLGGTLYYLSRSQYKLQEHTRRAKECQPFIAHPHDFSGASFQMLKSYGAS
ncbi:hypothetical protein GOP47_0013741 [Adiantum capillus-veneris]|uniref:Oleosin n=1 Tax=Adiantum capillus-veneris TaxID=13818 RepID=A0A9D4UP37_ADICA|nr:hypothetical protein GOP47_0013741 [Adiantum capillus-veneris]